MAYSRWSYSTWYTYWSSDKSYEFKWPTKKIKNEQTFRICDSPDYIVTYGELMRKGLDTVLSEIAAYYRRDCTETVIKEGKNGLPRYHSVAHRGKHPTDEEVEELSLYLLEFIQDVDEHFKWKNFFAYEWYYPLKNKIWNIGKN